MGRYLASIDWSSLFASLDTCEDIWNVCNAVVQSGPNYADKTDTYSPMDESEA